MFYDADVRVLLFLLAACSAAAQQAELKPLNAASARSEYRIAVREGRSPFTIRVQIGARGTIDGAQVFREGESTAFQTLPGCETQLDFQLFEGDEDRVLAEHADFNFDGFEDVELLQFYHPHLGKSIYCVFLWDEKTAQFRFEPEIPMPDPKPDSKTKRITSHNEYFGGTHSDAVYVWRAGKVVKIAEWGLTNDGGAEPPPKCGWFTFCDKRIGGKMRQVGSRRTGCGDGPVEELVCTPPSLNVAFPPARAPR